MKYLVHGHLIDESGGISDNYVINWAEDMIACTHC
jgi:hypothetical protein